MFENNQKIGKKGKNLTKNQQERKEKKTKVPFSGYIPQGGSKSSTKRQI